MLSSRKVEKKPTPYINISRLGNVWLLDGQVDSVKIWNIPCDSLEEARAEGWRLLSELIEDKTAFFARNNKMGMSA